MPPVHALPPGTATAGQSFAKPICAGVKRSGPVQVMPSTDAVSQALQIFPTFFDSALAIAPCAVLAKEPSGLVASPSGHGPLRVPLSTSFRHLRSALSFASRNFVVSCSRG